MSTLSLDFETRSTVDLPRCGTYVYAEHPTTDIWCLAWALDDGPVNLWTPDDGYDEELAQLITECELRAWNAAFERLIWREIMAGRYGFPEPTLEQWHDTAAEAAALALPRALGQAASVLGLDVQKDDDGRRLMLQMAKPRKPKKGEPTDEILWWDDDERKQRLYAYCKRDVEVEREIAKRLRRLTPFEREVYLLDQRVNDRGVKLDLDLIHAAKDVVKIGTDHANEELEELTGVESVTKVADLTRWLQHEGGLDIDNLRKATVRDLLEGDDDLPPDVERALEIRSEAGKTSNAKLDAMLRYACSDSRARGLLLYHGASTGRWSGKGIQPQNFTRGTVKNTERFVQRVLDRDYEAIDAEAPALAVISSMLRSMLRASPGCRLIGGDYSQIEARVLAWIAGQQDLVDLFAAEGKVYEDMASYIYNLPVEEISKDSYERQIGKNSVLGAGFQMGADRFADQVWEQTGIELPRGARDDDGELLPGEVDEAARAINGYRTRYPAIPQFWRDINDAAFMAVAKPGSVHTVGVGGTIKYTMRGQFLWCQLPSGRFLAYALPEIRPVPVPWDETGEEKRPAVTFAGVNSITRKWQRRAAYGGLLTENVVQAMARDLLASGMIRAERAGYPIVLTVHDEVVSDVPNDHGSLEEFMNLLLTRPRWAAGLPIAGEGWEGERYRK